MDLFLKDIQVAIFRKWVYYQLSTHKDIKVEFYDERTYKIYYRDKVSRFVVWPIGIIEEAIYQGDDLLFYLHYQFHDFYFARDLFDKMMYKLLEDSPEVKNILLCCSGGMTTGYFALQLNDYCAMNHLPYHIDATAQYQLLNVCQDYDLILLAPQLRYQSIDIQTKASCDILNIEPRVFASYDCQAMMQVIENYFQSEVKDCERKG